MFDLYDELKTSVSTFQNNILVKKVDGDDGGTFYGYTVGWGKTSEEVRDHERGVRNASGGSIALYSCRYLGTSTSCLWGSLGCITVSTFRCNQN